jgi:hypothetical protein
MQAALVSDVAKGLCDWHLVHGEKSLYVPPSTPAIPERLLNYKSPEPEPAQGGEIAPPSSVTVHAPHTYTPVPTISVGDEIVRQCADNILRLSQRDQDVLRAGATLERPAAAAKLRISEESVKSRLTSLCTRIGVPRTSKGYKVDRPDVVRRAFTLIDKPST